MRAHLKIITNGRVIPFDHQHLLVGTIHKWLGCNDQHGKLSQFSFSRLEGGKASSRGLTFEKEASFFISSFQNEMIQKLVAGIQNDPDMFLGLRVVEIVLQQDPDLTERDVFMVASPIFIKRREGDKITHVFYDDTNAGILLKDTLLTKMQEVGLSDSTLDISFDLNYPKAQVKKVSYKGIQNKANWCSVIIKGKPETKAFAWNVGLGNSTGIGFGAIK